MYLFSWCILTLKEHHGCEKSVHTSEVINEVGLILSQATEVDIYCLFKPFIYRLHSRGQIKKLINWIIANWHIPISSNLQLNQGQKQQNGEWWLEKGRSSEKMNMPVNESYFITQRSVKDLAPQSTNNLINTGLTNTVKIQVSGMNICFACWQLIPINNLCIILELEGTTEVTDMWNMFQWNLAIK